MEQARVLGSHPGLPRGEFRRVQQVHLAPRCSFAPCRYFRSKSRAGVARLDESLALYVMPCGEDWQLEHARTVLELAGQDIQALRSIYSLGPHIPRMGCLIGMPLRAS